MLRMVLRYGPAVGAFLTLVPIIWRMVLDAIVLYSNEPDRRNRALMLRFPHLAKLDDRLPSPATEHQASTAKSSIDKKLKVPPIAKRHVNRE